MEEPTKQQRNVLVAIVVVVAAVAIALVAVVAGGDDDGDTTTTSRPTTTTTAPSSTTTTVADADLAIAAYPHLTAGERAADPVALAKAFAVEVLGFRDDVVAGELQQGDARSGEVAVRPASTSAITTVQVRQISDGSWVVVGAATDSIELEAPVTGAVLGSPEPLRGAASAFEGHVDVRLLADGAAEAIATTFVTGRGDGTLGPFEGQLRFTAPEGARYGVLVLTAPNGEDGSTNAATAVRVRF